MNEEEIEKMVADMDERTELASSMTFYLYLGNKTYGEQLT